MYDLYKPRDMFTEDHIAFGHSVQEFLDRHVIPNFEKWEEDGIVPREAWLEAGRQGLLDVPMVGDGDEAQLDFRFRVAAIERFSRLGAASFAAGISCHTDIVTPYLDHLVTDEQRARWMPKLSSGEYIGAIAMTEPGAGSDLQGIKTSAVRDGDDWILNGNKTFITSGYQSDLIIVVARTNPDPAAGSKAFTLFVVEEGMAGFSRGRKLKKIGLRAQDTAELNFDNVRVSSQNLLGVEGEGLYALMRHLPMERLGIAVSACSGTRAALSWTLDYITERQAFGKPLSAFQNTQFEIADMVSQLEVMQAYVDASVLKNNRGELSAVDAAKAKLRATTMHKEVVDRCLQLFGGYGYMLEYPIARAYADVRITTIFGGTSEIMKLIIARDVLGKK